MPPVSAQDGVAPRSQQGLLAVPGQESTVKGEDDPGRQETQYVPVCEGFHS